MNDERKIRGRQNEPMLPLQLLRSQLGLQPLNVQGLAFLLHGCLDKARLPSLV